MKKIILIALLLNVFFVYTAIADPFLRLSINKNKIQKDSVVQLKINNVVKEKLYIVVIDKKNKMYIDCQAWEGKKKIEARIGNPWEKLTGIYKWTKWSSSFSYTFPFAAVIPKIDLVVSSK